MKIVYFGTGSFAVPALRAVAKQVVLVVTQPDRPGKRGMHLQPSEVKVAATELGLPLATPEKARDPEFVEQVKALVPDMLLVASYGQILSTKLLESARRGGINLHGSLLPKYRGAAPIQRCIQEGHEETGVTLMQMDKGMDTGDMIAVKRIAIGPEETYGELQDRLAQISSELAQQWIERIASGDYPRLPQNPNLATMAPKIEKGEAELHIERDAREQYDAFRAFTPSPGAFLRTGAGLLKLSKARFSEQSGEPGTILEGGTGCLLAFEGGSIDILELQPEGKKRMGGRDFLNGLRLRPGAKLG